MVEVKEREMLGCLLGLEKSPSGTTIKSRTELITEFANSIQPRDSLRLSLFKRRDSTH
jgi:hypothetical protein